MKTKKSLIWYLTLFYTLVVSLVIISTVLVLRTFVENYAIKAYTRMIAERFIRSRNIGVPFPPSRGMREQMPMHFSVPSMIKEKVVIFNNEILSDPYGISEKIKGIPENKFPYKYKENGVYYLFIQKRFAGGHRLIVGGPSLEFTAILNTFNKLAIFISVFGIGVSFLISFFLVRRSLNPIIKISKEIEQVDINSLEKRIPDQKFKEFQILAEKLNCMLDRIKKGYDMQEQFVSDVSHELRTPITAIQGYINLIKRWGDKNREIYEESLLRLEKSTRNLKNLIDSLLMLSKNYENVDAKKINLKKFLISFVEEYLDITDMNITLKSEDCVVETNEEMLKLLLKPIVDNAIKYTKKVNRDEIEIYGGKKGIVIVDHGKGISEEDKEKIFERFYKSEKSRSTEGFGLGLSISMKIAKVLGFNIKVYNGKKYGAIFVIKFN